MFYKNLKIVTWNINSIRARIDIFVDFINTYDPDVILLQEIKCEEELFPRNELSEMLKNNYYYAISGQKSYNGVCIMSKHTITNTNKYIKSNYITDARYIESIINNIYFISVYVPNGGEVDSDKYIYKLEFMDFLYERLKTIMEYDKPIIIGGDFNIAFDNKDVYDPINLDGQICFSKHERQKLNAIFNLGFLDSFRMFNNNIEFSWWNYKNKGFELNSGMRIDYILTSPCLLKKYSEVKICKEIRGIKKTSDHAPQLLSI